MGHAKNYVPTDVFANFRRMQGYHVMHPMGWDAFGLPTERYAVRENEHPADVTKRNTETFPTADPTYRSLLRLVPQN